MASNAASTAASSVANAVKRATKSCSPRSISIAVSPTPVSFAERRSVLQVLERYGRIEFFKLIPNHDSMFISLMKEEEAARKLVATSPISYNVFVPQTSSESQLSSPNPSQTLSKAKPITALTPPNPPTAETETLPDRKEAGAELPQKEFQIHIFAQPSYRHHASSDTKLHLPWPAFVGQNNSFLAKTLKQSLPNKMAAKGLANWDPDFGQQRMASNPAIKKQDRIRETSWTPSKLLARAHRPQGEVKRDERGTRDNNKTFKKKRNYINKAKLVKSPPISTSSG
ncbi:hypothetical protein BGZ63DRAFT_423663 [Mariannaea sp. PMI_226]|nr:hypothetical protein BGZ63DRAFT_423663 [Mariannaea sp. PMI_226]